MVSLLRRPQSQWTTYWRWGQSLVVINQSNYVHLLWNLDSIGLRLRCYFDTDQHRWQTRRVDRRDSQGFYEPSPGSSQPGNYQYQCCIQWDLRYLMHWLSMGIQARTSLLRLPLSNPFNRLFCQGFFASPSIQTLLWTSSIIQST